ncbi:MAG TPA: bifunctional 4-hydroxy-2-oxoglutarate aldolase/2-dehydro-3-deoxy-phosphogluconate aldolase [Niabella sp.]|nr:bifunctional 4-hydroxy-2-oxoglutarate aldolase/2-dehydro-3-deoxy-phosphogluconate aldolase [Niabella sp.]HOZ97746.1 bifunctional 4-hydroxy-2-oxoglutarate aldolase/2-dehydro-3-deoxy-phosphogluconate aldolase [Niabella sp.]HQW14061.1 bifunctional 4-hydroxy-2-oxoglutarate aldolase/2-dehydro-3-deoxy-phosphogluconate aldolase [Niabella sp.]HQX19396.1 bifunctional 4-hydroxy-2-oxoglutarate aldolase/2-dehydro-3-deoxy-phosphogluconate aldolase [Niabella sp.]HQX40251.1 bifunctional 4-hydroxy-2-oxoglut
MSKTQEAIDAIIEQGMLPLYFNADEIVSVEVLRAVYKAGVKAIEYTNRGEAALSNFKKLVEVRNAEMPGLLLGIGTVKNMEMVSAYLDAGADFLVSPGFVPEIAAHAVANDIFYAPGCMTPSEIIAAENAGIRFIKLFPGDMLGPKYLSTIKDIFPKLLFMPTGGVDTTKESVESWYKAGVCAVGMGSKLISKQLMADKNYDAIATNTKAVFEIIGSVRN